MPPCPGRRPPGLNPEGVRAWNGMVDAADRGKPPTRIELLSLDTLRLHASGREMALRAVAHWLAMGATPDDLYAVVAEGIELFEHSAIKQWERAETRAMADPEWGGTAAALPEPPPPPASQPAAPASPGAAPAAPEPAADAAVGASGPVRPGEAKGAQAPAQAAQRRTRAGRAKTSSSSTTTQAKPPRKAASRKDRPDAPTTEGAAP